MSNEVYMQASVLYEDCVCVNRPGNTHTLALTCDLPSCMDVPCRYWYGAILVRRGEASFVDVFNAIQFVMMIGFGGAG